MKKLLFVAALFFLGYSANTAPKSHPCPICGGNMCWMGDVSTDGGRMSFKMECPQGHISWESDNSTDYRSQSNDNKSNTESYSKSKNSYLKEEQPTCARCGFKMYATGNVNTNSGKMLYEYECNMGHKSYIAK